MRYNVWSVKHQMWWAPNEQGYVMNVAMAGLYTREQVTVIEERSQQARHFDQISVGIPVTAL